MKLQFGEYVSLGKVEAELKTCSLVENICVYGDSNKDYTVALVVPQPSKLSQVAQKLGKSSSSIEEMCKDSDIEKEVLKEIQAHGKKSKWRLTYICMSGLLRGKKSKACK